MFESVDLRPHAPQGEPPRPAPQSARQPAVFLLLILLAVIVIVALFTMTALNRLDRATARLEEENKQLRARVTQVERSSQSAARQASDAAQSARTAAGQRDQAQVAQAQSASAAAAAQQQAAAAEQTAEQYRREREAELEHVRQVLSQIADTRRTPTGLVVTLGSKSIRFDFDKSDIKPPDRETLSRIAGVLMTLKGYSMYVYGYTDDVGTADYNLKLSERRAQAVRDLLVQNGLDPKIISTKGFGKSDPRVLGQSSQARATNRRVEIGIVDSTLKVMGQVPPSQ